MPIGDRGAPAFRDVLGDVLGTVRRTRQTGQRDVEAAVRRAAPLWPAPVVRQATEAVRGQLDGPMGLLAPLSDPDVSEVMINGTEVWVERAGRLARTTLELSTDEVGRLIEGLVGPAGARVDRASPIADVRLPDGSRASIVLPPLAVDGPYVTIRRFVLREAGLDDFAHPPVAALLADAVGQRRNLVVSGGTGTGKTTLLNALAAHVGPDERLVTIEDTAELRLRHRHVVRLQARPANSEGIGEVPIRQLVRTALRMRPDRILVGESRGAEVVDMLQAMNTGHEGSMSTCHANSPRDALRRLEALALLGDGALSADFVRDQLASALRLLVHVVRCDDGRRRVRDVVAVLPSADWRRGTGLEVVVRDGRLCGPPGTAS